MDEADFAFIEGRHACKTGRQRDTNPYLHGTPMYAAWDRGWSGAHDWMMQDLAERGQTCRDKTH